MITSNGENKKSLIENLSRTRMKVQKKKLKMILLRVLQVTERVNQSQGDNV